jgi:hypothetical protein
MRRIHRKHETIQKAPPVARRSAEQGVIVGREPKDAAMLCESGGGTDGLPVYAADAPAAFGIVADADLRFAELSAEPQRGGEASSCALPHDVGEIRAPQAAPRREQRNRLEYIGLARTIVAGQRHHVRADLYVERAIVPERRQRQARDAPHGRGYTRMGIST